MKERFTANTVEEAKALAAQKFGVSAEKITFSVIEEEKKGFLGFGKSDAIIEAEYEPSKAEIAADYVKSILKCMDIDAELNVTENEDGALIEIVGDTTGAVIGKRGETLDAIQYLASMTANKNDKEYYRINLDSCGYREKRKATLENLAFHSEIYGKHRSSGKPAEKHRQYQMLKKPNASEIHKPVQHSFPLL